MSLDGILALGAVVALSGGLSAILIALLMPLLQRYAMARPNARSSHRAPTPQGAGFAVVAATWAAAAAGLMFFPDAQSGKLTLMLVASLVVAAVGAVDDLRPMPVPPRLALQAVAVTLALLATGLETTLFPFLPFWLEKMLLLLAGLWFVNLVNFMDGIDWMTVAEAVPVAAALVLLGAFGALPALSMLLAAALCGALIGFAPFNRPVARVFLGDVGSLPIGLLLGWCLLELIGRGHLISAILLPLYYLCDATLTLVRRAANREAVWTAHRTHFYQRATDNGFSVMAVVSRVFGLNVFLAALALVAALYRSPLVGGLALAAGVVATAAVLAAFARRRPVNP